MGRRQSATFEKPTGVDFASLKSFEQIQVLS
jgi:hypothetical protein